MKIKFGYIMITIIMLCLMQIKIYAIDSTAVTNNEATVKSTEDATKSTEDVAKSTEDATKSTEDVAKSTEDATKSTEDVAKSTEDATKSTEDVAKSTEDAVKSTEDADKSTEDATESTEDVAKSTEDAVKSTEDVDKNTEDVAQSAKDATLTEKALVQVKKNIIVTGSDANSIDVDGYSDDWDDKPYSYEYNWDNPSEIQNYWDGSKNITKEYTDENGKPYNLDIRHKMSLFCDGEYVYLHIVFSTQYQSRFNGEDYQFKFGNQQAAFQVEKVGGGTITNNTGRLSEGIHKVEVRHRDSKMSYGVAEGAEAYLNIKNNNINDELELKIPLTAMKEQNPNIDIENFQTVQFFTPNLMYRKLSTSGTSTGPYMGVIICMGVCSVGYLKVNKRRKKL